MFWVSSSKVLKTVTGKFVLLYARTSQNCSKPTAKMWAKTRSSLCSRLWSWTPNPKCQWPACKAWPNQWSTFLPKTLKTWPINSKPLVKSIKSNVKLLFQLIYVHCCLPWLRTFPLKWPKRTSSPYSLKLRTKTLMFALKFWKPLENIWFIAETCPRCTN